MNIGDSVYYALARVLCAIGATILWLFEPLVLICLVIYFELRLMILGKKIPASSKTNADKEIE